MTRVQKEGKKINPEVIEKVVAKIEENQEDARKKQEESMKRS